MWLTGRCWAYWTLFVTARVGALWVVLAYTFLATCRSLVKFILTSLFCFAGWWMAASWVAKLFAPTKLGSATNVLSVTSFSPSLAQPGGTHTEKSSV